MIKFTITPEAEKRIQRIADGKNLLLKLKYETDGCGCTLSGVPALELINEQDIDQDDVTFETNSIPVLMEKSKLIFFDDELKIDFSEESQSFRLVSPSQILNGRMRCIVKSS